ncbi:DUF262 domain-containing protein (plasmid) [Aeromonas media]|uniref:DUF262 domain-containing protein n=1 Tax=Aeromonas media TaxID=651 RepID=A0ABX6NY17_AERME|nr:DUF262 domain-containing protein [Aeromonas media]QJT37113.1 DUF262 domain-containing protein [Aeromonas media]QJT41283.1 DUF262 domain-containing protein [Aeromonas media]
MPIPAPLLSGTRRDYTIGHLINSTPEGGDNTVRSIFGFPLPVWQRAEAWTEKQKVRFVEGIFLGLGTGFYVINGRDWDESGPLPCSAWLLDGQQRLGALRDFIQKKMVIFGDVTFESMTPQQSRKFLNLPFPCYELEYTADEGVLLELYDRLNYGGTLHELDAESADFQKWKANQG